MGVVSHQVKVDAPRERVFEYVDGYQNVPEYLFGVKRFTPTTEQTQGLGSTFEVAIDVGPKTLKSVVKCTQHIPNELIELRAVEGFSANSTWKFSDAEDGGTEMTVAFDFKLPGGIAGKLLGGLIGPFADQAVKHSEETIAKKFADHG